MQAKEIHEILDGMLSDPKAKNFLNHLVKAYVPLTNVEKVFETPKENFKCVLTKQNLCSVQDIMDAMQSDEFKQNFMTHLKSIFSENFKTENPLVKLIGDKKLGVTGNQTNTYMSYETLQEFYNWLMTKTLNGDKHINWLLGPIKKSFMNQEKDNKEKDNKEKVNKKPESSTSTFTLGELESFKKLKEKFKN
jgi:hypothetical protein